jgi:hypothetical protein
MGKLLVTMEKMGQLVGDLIQAQKTTTDEAIATRQSISLELKVIISS